MLHTLFFGSAVTNKGAAYAEHPLSSSSILESIGSAVGVEKTVCRTKFSEKLILATVFSTSRRRDANPSFNILS